MPIEIDEYCEELLQEVHTRADADGWFVEDAFFDVLSETLIDAGDIETADRVHYVSPRGIRVDGYGGDPLDADGTLSLIIADFNQSHEVATLTATDMNATFRRLHNFLERSLNAEFRNSLEESAPAFGLADLIANRWSRISKVRLFLMSNRVLSSRVDGREAGEFQGVPVTYSVWDLGRVHRYTMSGHEREDVAVSMDEFGGPLVVLPAHAGTTDHESYLAVVPGIELAKIYDRWGARLLEQNVRVFLQARGKVNRGIRNTIANDPDMFFAYNNGITATAESIETEESPFGLLLTGMRNFQIVNGGQTTASIHEALGNKEADLGRVFVQMKLSVVEPERALEVVPKISEYANSQNRVSAADFFSNHPFHVRMEDFSRRLFAPSRDGSFRQSKWFYERARGQYQDARGHRTPAERARFDLEYPKRQVFTKTDLAKFLNVWRGKPDTVSKGAQKNFADFAQFIGEEWRRRPNEFNEMFFREAVAKAIMFRAVEQLVGEQPWYEGGYRANVVAYTIAKLARDVAQWGESINFERIWRAQEISPGLRDALTAGAEAVHEVIVNPPERMRNVTEWAKQQACWNRVEHLDVAWPTSLSEELLSTGDRSDARRDAVKDQRMLNGIDVQTTVVEAGPEFWGNLKEWGVSRGLLSPSEMEILDVAVSPSRIPTERQSARIIETLSRLIEEGFPSGSELL
ncbi:MAG: AIPR family protein [Chloroflexota bacterium]|nr:AIPR family protein [Chloroflexota bacterium]MDE2886565.1 AIPR family protein [Chloroflexota bacterium]